MNFGKLPFGSKSSGFGLISNSQDQGKHLIKKKKTKQKPQQTNPPSLQGIFKALYAKPNTDIFIGSIFSIW